MTMVIFNELLMGIFNRYYWTFLNGYNGHFETVIMSVLNGLLMSYNAHF